MPVIGQPNRTTTIPPKKHAVPLSLCAWKKNLKVLSNPITKANPDMKRIYLEKKLQTVN